MTPNATTFPRSSSAQQLPRLATAGSTVGAAVSSRDSRSDLPSQLLNPNAWKRASSPVADAYADLVGSERSSSNIDEMLASRQPGDRSSVRESAIAAGVGGAPTNGSAANGASSIDRRRTQYYEDQFQYKDNATSSIKDRVQRESPIIAELRTNVIIKDEFTLVTDLSFHLAARYTRPDSSIMIKVDHSACLALGGTFDPCYILTITAIPSQLGLVTNKRNAALVQSFMADILSVPPDRGIVKFQPIEEQNYAMNGVTMAGEIDRLEKLQREEGHSAVRRAITTASRKSIPSFNKPSTSKPETSDMRSPITLPTANGTALASDRERKRRSSTFNGSDAAPGGLANVFELPATEPDERPSTSHGAYAAENGLRMNGISKEDLLQGGNNKTPNGRPKTIATQSPSSREVSEPLPPQRQPSTRSQHRQSSVPRTENRKSTAGAGNIPTSPKPLAAVSSPRPAEPAKYVTSPPVVAPAPVSARPQATYLDGVSTSVPATIAPVTRPSTATTAVPAATSSAAERFDPKIDAKAAEKNRQSMAAATAAASMGKDTAANTAKRRSTVTATPRMPAPPPVPEERRSKKDEARVGKRKSFLSAFRRG